MDLARLTQSTAPKRSLAIPKTEPPAEYRAYVEHPEVATLNQIMLHYLDIEEILKLYRQDHEQFETRQALNTLAQRFELPAATDFKQLLRNYDMQYVTVRSYLYDNRDSEDIMLDAASEGNIQALYNLLKLYPKLRKKTVYNEALGRAAKGGHEVIIELLLKLGARDKHKNVFTSAVTGGQLALVQKELDKGIKRKYIYDAVHVAAKKRYKNVVAALLDYRLTYRILDRVMEGAGYSGDISMIDYVISRGGNNYKKIIDAAVEYQHLNVIRHYWHKLTKTHRGLNDRIRSCAIKYANLEMVKFVIEKKLLSQVRLSNNLEELKQRRANVLAEKSRAYKPNRFDNQLAKIDSVIAYLESNGASDYVESTSYESSEDSLPN